MKKGIVLTVLLAVIVIAALVLVYYLFFFSSECSDKQCFYESLGKCKLTTFIKQDSSNIIEYSILGREENKCRVNVLLLQVKQGGADLEFLEGSSMDCYPDLGVITEPEKNLAICHGILKEQIQEIIIKRMHTQIVENLGKISSETTSVL